MELRLAKTLDHLQPGAPLGRIDALPLAFNLDGPVALRGRAAAVEVWGAYWPASAASCRGPNVR